MSTTPQLIANRENAQHSTGPTTEEGKRAVRLNAVRHGLTGRTVLLPHEDQQRYEKLKNDYLRELAPKTSLELSLVHTILNCNWRLERGAAAETNLLTAGHLLAQPSYIADIENPEVQTALVEALGYERCEKALRNIGIQEARLSRAMYKAMAELRALQKERKSSEAQAAALAEAQAALQAKAQPNKPNRFLKMALSLQPPNPPQPSPPRTSPHQIQSLKKTAA